MASPPSSESSREAPLPIEFPPFHLPNGRIRIPTGLPPRPIFEPVQLDELDLDDELSGSGATLDYTLNALRGLATKLLQAGSLTTGIQGPGIHDASSPFPLLRCTRPPPPHSPPTHVLELQFTDTGEHYRTPVHGLVWALQSPLLPQLCRRFIPPGQGVDDATSPSNEFLLPLVAIRIPCRPAWPLLHKYLYDGSAAQLLNSLLATPDALPPRTLSLDAAAPPPDPLQPQLDSLVTRLMRVREVWLDAQALELSDRKVWDTLERAYDVLVSELQDVCTAVPGATMPDDWR